MVGVVKAVVMVDFAKSLKRKMDQWYSHQQMYHSKMFYIMLPI